MNNVVRLSAEEVAIANMAGVSLAEYAQLKADTAREIARVAKVLPHGHRVGAVGRWGFGGKI